MATPFLSFFNILSLLEVLSFLRSLSIYNGLSNFILSVFLVVFEGRNWSRPIIRDNQQSIWEGQVQFQWACPTEGATAAQPCAGTGFKVPRMITRHATTAVG